MSLQTGSWSQEEWSKEIARLLAEEHDRHIPMSAIRPQGRPMTKFAVHDEVEVEVEGPLEMMDIINECAVKIRAVKPTRAVDILSTHYPDHVCMVMEGKLDVAGICIRCGKAIAT